VTKEKHFMSKPIAATLLAVGLSFAISTAGQAASVPAAGVLSTLQATDAVAQARVLVTPRGAAVVRRGPVVVAPRARVVGPRAVVAPRAVVGVPRAYVGRPFRAYRFARPWSRRAYYGTVIGGVALGTILAVAAAPTVAPAPGLCWYWADPYETRGYWDYCY
jgi:hypothetical protein